MLALAVERFRSMRNPPEKARTLLISIAPLQYNVPNYSFTGLSVFTNHITGGAFRGYGNTQLTFGREILMDRLAQRLNISPHQLSYVTNSGEGEGLLFYGNVILPFIDRFPTDLELYRIMTTKLNEVAQEKEA